MAGVLDGCKPGAPRGFDVLDAVVEEENLVRWMSELRDGNLIEPLVGFCESQTMREGKLRKMMEPRTALEDARFHCVSNVGQNAGGDGEPLKGCCPIDHRLIGNRPEVDIGRNQGLNFGLFGLVADLRADSLPEGDSVEHTEIVIVARAPVGVVETRIGGVEDLLHATPRVGVRWAGENEAQLRRYAQER